MEKIEHIGIAVKDLEAASLRYKKLLGKAPYKVEGVEAEKVKTSFFKLGESKIELLQATDEKSAIAKFISKKGEGIHHIAYAVEDIKSEMERLKKEGFELLSDEPRRGADGKWVVFIHPKSAGGVLIELCQDMLTPDIPDGSHR